MRLDGPPKPRWTIWDELLIPETARVMNAIDDLIWLHLRSERFLSGYTGRHPVEIG